MWKWKNGHRENHIVSDGLTIDGHSALVFDFSIIVFDDATVFAIQLDGGCVHDQLVRLSIVGFLEFSSLLGDFDTIQEPLNGTPKQYSQLDSGRKMADFFLPWITLDRQCQFNVGVTFVDRNVLQFRTDIRGAFNMDRCFVLRFAMLIFKFNGVDTSVGACCTGNR